ncbi:unnamed protein product, partial [Ectocarpus sp. 8 AP-2014]
GVLRGTHARRGRNSEILAKIGRSNTKPIYNNQALSKCPIVNRAGVRFLHTCSLELLRTVFQMDRDNFVTYCLRFFRCGSSLHSLECSPTYFQLDRNNVFTYFLGWMLVGAPVSSVVLRVFSIRFQ